MTKTGTPHRATDWHARPDDADRAVGEEFEHEELARSYPHLYREQSALGELFRARQRLVLELLAAQKGGRLLDAGCGAGMMSKYLVDHRPGDFSITALDRSHAMIDEARATIGGTSGVEFVVDRIESMPFEDAAFDVALALGVLEYVADVSTAVADLARVVRPGGLVIVSMQNRRSPYRLWETAVFRHVRRLRGAGPDSVVERPVDEIPLRRTLKDAGLTPTDVVYYNFNLLLEPFSYWFPERSMRMTRRLARLGRGPLRRLGADLLVAARRDAASAPRE